MLHFLKVQNPYHNILNKYIKRYVRIQKCMHSDFNSETPDSVLNSRTFSYFSEGRMKLEILIFVGTIQNLPLSLLRYSKRCLIERTKLIPQLKNAVDVMKFRQAKELGGRGASLSVADSRIIHRRCPPPRCPILRRDQGVQRGPSIRF